MGSLAAADEDEAAKRHSHPPPPPSPSPQQQQQQQRLLWPPPPTQHRERRIHETVINGTTWYHQTPSLPHFHTDSPLPLHSPARYGSFDAFHSMNFGGTPPSHPSIHGQPHSYPPNDSTFGNARISPSPHPAQVHVTSPYLNGSASSYPPDYACGDGVHGAAVGVAPGYPYPGMGSMHTTMPGYPCNVQNQGMPGHPYDGYARPYMPPGNAYVGMTIPNPGSLQGPAQGLHSGYMVDHTWYGMPPHSVRSSGKTLRQTVTWSGMTMPVTITSQAAAVIDWLQRQTGELYGFDLEWKPNRLKDEDNSVALLQLCGPTECLIIQLLYTDMIPRMLKEFLLNAKKWLGGVGIRQDVKKLEKDHDLVCQGQVELGLLASEKLQRDDLQWRGLKKLVDQVLGMTLVKVKKITMSNWDRETLDEKQIEYACIDAWAAYAILHKLMTL